MNTTIFLIRHAQSHPTQSLADSEHPLSPVGTNQAKKLGAVLGSLNLEKVISSPYKRCVDTVRPFLDSTGIEFDFCDGLRERKIAEGLVDNFHEVWEQSWADFSFSLPRCESSYAAQERIFESVQKHAENHPGKNIGIVSHGNVLGLFLNHLDSSFLGDETKRIRNPDLLKVSYRNGEFCWHREFRHMTLDQISTDYGHTPTKRRQ